MQKLQLSIPEPCHENWHGMTPTDKGRFCQSCSKEVIDFSMMTDTEVLNYFSQLSHEKVCGRTMPSQLDREIVYPKEPKKRLFWHWNYIAMFFMFFVKSNETKAQGQLKTHTEQSPVKPGGTADEIQVTGQAYAAGRVITGRVVDEDGNPVSFATIKVKGAATAFSADAAGKYSVRVQSVDVLLISAAGFKLAEVPVGYQNVINTMLDKMVSGLLGETVVVVGGMGWNDAGYPGPYKKHTAFIQVREDGSHSPVANARLIITEKNKSDSVYTDKKGNYKLKAAQSNGEYYLKVEAAGYEPTEFSISSTDFAERKKVWEVLLIRQKDEKPVTSVPGRKFCAGATAWPVQEDTLFVVDGTVMAGRVDIKEEEVDEYNVLSAAEAMAIFGIRGTNGAVLITTRKSKVKELKEVVVASEFGIKRRAGGMGVVCFVEKQSVLAELRAGVQTMLTDSLKIYPNPVERGNGLNVSLKLKRAGEHYIQLSDASGRVVLQKQVNAASGTHTEMLVTRHQWSAGVYYIRVFDARNRLVSKSSFIVR